MRNLALAAALLAITGVAAGGTEDFPHGGWATNTASPEAYISIGVPKEAGPFLFSIRNSILTDNVNVAYQITRDGSPITPISVEGNGVLIEGQNVSIRQNANGSSMPGTWSVIYPNGSPWVTGKNGWSAFPGQPTIVASFSSQRLMVIEIDKQIQCTGASMQLQIDDAPLKKGDGSVLIWPESSAVLTYGKKVAVSVAGSCPQSTGATGSISFVFPKTP